MTAAKAEAVEFQCSYGPFQKRYLKWFLPILFVTGPIVALIGIFNNRDWEIARTPLPPWLATTIFELLGLGALAMGVGIVISTRMHRKSPQRIAVTRTSLIVPKGRFSKQEQVLPRSELKLKVYDVGFVKQLKIMHGRRQILLASAKFPTDEEFDQLVSHLLPE